MPSMCLVGDQMLKAKTPQLARCDRTLDLSGLNGNRATATARVVQTSRPRLSVLRPAHCGQHGRSQRLLQGRLPLVQAPTALEQRLPRGVQGQGHGVLGQVHINAHMGPTHVHIRPDACALPKTICNRVLDFERRKIQTLQRAVLRCDFNLEGLTLSEPKLPRQGLAHLVNIRLVLVMLLAQLDQYPLGQTGMQIELHHLSPRGHHLHAPALR